jgi:glycosyltransferase involved in cell wall biosynthesis
VYNGEKFVAQAISSVLRQTYRDFELLVADDCSTDESLNIVETLAQQDNRIRFFRNATNLGLFANYNACVERSSGKYIKFLAQDDILHETSLQTTVPILEENATVAIVSTARGWIDDEGRDISEFVGTPASSLYVPSAKIVAGQEVLRQSLSSAVNFIGEPSTVIVRKSHCQRGFNDLYHHLGDLDLWLAILRNGDYFHVDDTLSMVRSHDDSSSAANVRELLFVPDMVRLCTEFEDVLAGFGDSYERALHRWARALSNHVRSLEATNEVTAAALKSSQCDSRYKNSAEDQTRTGVDQRILDDLLAFREFMFYAMIDPQPARSVRWLQGQSLQDEGVADLEMRLRQILKSPSWKVTRWLRELNTSIRIAGRSDSEPAIKVDFDDRSAYTKYLKTQISRIKQSRSWKLTGRLRQMGIL